MIVRSGLAHSVPVLFEKGIPDGDVTWTLFDTAGAQLSSGTAPVPDGAVSIAITLDAADNTLPLGALTGTRDLDWHYTVAGLTVNGTQRYSVEARPPFGASADGVRAKLGVNEDELPDGDISLIAAFRYLRTTAGSDNVLAVSDNGGDGDSILRDAVEAFAALSLLPTMPLRIALSESSGTNQYKRQEIDWNALEGPLSAIVDAGITLALPTYDPMSNVAALFVLATPSTDPITGGSYTST